MPRQPRFWFPGAALHVVQRGNNRAPVFVDDDDRHPFVDDLLVATCKHRVAVHAYVLMTNHVHLLATPLAADAMPRTMQTAGRRYATIRHCHIAPPPVSPLRIPSPAPSKFVTRQITPTHEIACRTPLSLNCCSSYAACSISERSFSYASSTL